MRSEDLDPTRVRNQPSLQSSRRRLWLVSAGVLAAVTIAVFAMTAVLNPAVSIIGIGLVVAIFATMVVVAVVIGADRQRNMAFAILMIAMVVVSVGLLLLHVLQQSGSG